MKKKFEFGAFCETYGAGMENRVLEFLLENNPGDFAIGDIIEETGISKPKVYEIAKKFEKKGYLLKTRVVGKTQLYEVNTKNPKMKLFLRDFKECLRLIIEQYSTKNKSAGSSKAGSACAKTFR